MSDKKYPAFVIKFKNKDGTFVDVAALYTNDYGGFNVSWSRGVSGVVVDGTTMSVSKDERYTNGYKYKPRDSSGKLASNTDATDDL